MFHAKHVNTLEELLEHLEDGFADVQHALTPSHIVSLFDLLNEHKRAAGQDEITWNMWPNLRDYTDEERKEGGG